MNDHILTAQCQFTHARSPCIHHGDQWGKSLPAGVCLAEVYVISACRAAYPFLSSWFQLSNLLTAAEQVAIAPTFGETSMDFSILYNSKYTTLLHPILSETSVVTNHHLCDAIFWGSQLALSMARPPTSRAIGACWDVAMLLSQQTWTTAPWLGSSWRDCTKCTRTVWTNARDCLVNSDQVHSEVQ